MPISLTNSKDIVANSVLLINRNDVNDILDIISSIVGNAPPDLNTLEKLANAINRNPQIFYELLAMINTKFPTNGIVN